MDRFSKHLKICCLLTTILLFGCSSPYLSSKPSWYPTQVFHNGKKTYIHLGNSLGRTGYPAVEIADSSGEYNTASVNYHAYKDWIIIDAIVNNIRLVSGTKEAGDRTVVQISAY